MENQTEVQPIVKVFILGEKGDSIRKAQITIYKNSPPVCYRRVFNTHDFIIRFWNVRLERFDDVGVGFMNIVGSIGEVENEAINCWIMIAALIERTHDAAYMQGMKNMMNKAIEVMNNLD